MTSNVADMLKSLRAAGEPVESRRPPPGYYCPVCDRPWVPATTYEKTHVEVVEALTGRLTERPCPNHGGAQ